MRGEYAAIHEAIVDDADFRRLSSDAKVCWYTLRLTLGASGIALVRASVAQLEAATNIKGQALYTALNELVEGRWLIVQDDVLWLRNALKHNPNLKVSNENHRKAISKHLAGLPRCDIANTFAAYYDLPLPFDGVPSTWVSHRYPDAIPHPIPHTYIDPIPDPDTGIRRNGQTDSGAGAIAPEGEPSAGDALGEPPPGPSWDEAMAVIRSELSPNHPDETKRSGSVLKRDFGDVPLRDVIDACRGTRKLVEAGRVKDLKPGCLIGLRWLRMWHADDGRLLWDAALDHERLGDAGAPTPIANRTEMQRLSAEVPAHA